MTRFIWREPKPGDKTSRRLVMHVEIQDGLGRGLSRAICGTFMDFDRNSATPFAGGRLRPVCKSCLRSCEDVRRAA